MLGVYTAYTYTYTQPTHNTRRVHKAIFILPGSESCVFPESKLSEGKLEILSWRQSSLRTMLRERETEITWKGSVFAKLCCGDDTLHITQ